MVCLITDVPNHGSSTKTERLKASPPPVLQKKTSSARTMSMHERVLMLEADNASLQSMIDRLHERQYYSERNSRSILQGDIVDIILIASATALVIVIGKIILTR